MAAAALVGLALLAGPAMAQSARSDPAGLITHLHDGIMAATTATWPPDRQSIARLVNESFDLPGIVVAVLGRHVAASTPEQRARLADGFGNLMVRELVRRRPAPGDRFAVIETRATLPGEWLVITRFTPSGETAINLAWRVRADADGLHIVDMLREGVSAVITEKQDIASALSKSNLDAVTAEIERRGVRGGS